MTLFFLLSGHISQKQKFRSTKLSFNAIDSMPHQKYELISPSTSNLVVILLEWDAGDPL